MPELPFIPENVTVHLGPPSSDAPNVTVSFPDYIKNVASSEIYPTWPENAIRANILAQISFALNRIYTEYYRSRGYDFDITNSTAVDQYFVNGRDIFENISQIVDEIFNEYLRRPGSVEPLFAQYCNGTTVTCDGLSQWGSVQLAEQGYTPYEILTYYFGDNLDIVSNAPIKGIIESAPPSPLAEGTAGNDVRTVQLRLNRISQNYPNIPKIYPTDGVFGAETTSAVREFQRTFSLTPDGIVGNATWYKILRIFNAVKRLNELNSEGLTLADVTKQFPRFLAVGDTGDYIRVLQYYLNYVADFEDTVNPVAIDGVFGPATEAAVIAFQRQYGLTPDGIVGEDTWNKLTDVYGSIIDSLPDSLFENQARPYPNVLLRLGSEGEEVRWLQEYLNTVSDVYTEIPKLDADGVFGVQTRDAIYTFQRLFGLNTSGIVGPATWNAIADAYDDIVAGNTRSEGQYPGYEIGG